MPNFTGWRLFEKNAAVQQIQKTVEKYLPPITSKVIEFPTISKYMTYLQSLATSSNTPYVSTTLDVDAAINAYKFLWSNQQYFQNVVIQLSDFHFERKLPGKLCDWRKVWEYTSFIRKRLFWLNLTVVFTNFKLRCSYSVLVIFFNFWPYFTYIRTNATSPLKCFEALRPAWSLFLSC